MKPRFHTTARKAPDETSGLKVAYGAAKRQAPKWRWYLILLVVSSPLLYFAMTGAYSIIVVTAPGNIKLKQYELRASRAGYVKKLLASVGDDIAAGQQLIELGDPLLDQRQIKLSGELSALRGGAQTYLPSVERGLYEQIRLMERLVNEREAQLNTMRTLFNQGAATRAEVVTAQAQAIEARVNLNRARVDLAAEQQRHASKEDPQYASASGRIETELALVDHERAQLPQTANDGGRILDVFVSQGEFVSAGTPLMQVGLFSEPAIVAYLEPKHSRYVDVGTWATVTFPDGTKVTGQVTREPVLTKRLPAELVGTFGVRRMSVLLTIMPETEWPKQRLIEGLPLEIRFRYRWERSWGNWLGVAWGSLGDLFPSQRMSSHAVEGVPRSGDNG